MGASDDLARGRSTFMVEMIETAAILNQATPDSIVILDEVGRGTSTWDGLAIAWAAVEHLHEVNKCRALFATHYHELTGLSDTLSACANASLRAQEWKGDLVFLHEVKPGPADRSYGVQVAKLAGLPAAAVRRAPWCSRSGKRKKELPGVSRNSRRSQPSLASRSRNISRRMRTSSWPASTPTRSRRKRRWSWSTSSRNEPNTTRHIYGEIATHEAKNALNV